MSKQIELAVVVSDIHCGSVVGLRRLIVPDILSVSQIIQHLQVLFKQLLVTSATARV